MYPQFPRSRPANAFDRCNRLDIAEYQKNEIYRQGNDDAPNTANYGAPRPSSSYADSTTVIGGGGAKDIGFRDFEIYFDSTFITIPSNLAQGEIVFNVSDYNNGLSIGNVIEINLGSFYFPKPLNYTTTSPDPYFYRRIYMNIVGLPSTQSSRGANGSQYNFEFQVVDLNSIAVLLQPIKPSFYLQSILSAFNETRLHFTYGPNFDPVSLPKTKLSIQCVPASNPAQFTILSGDTVQNLDSTITPLTIYPVVLAVPVAVYISGFLPQVDVNNPQGLFVTRLIDATTFEIASISLAAVAVVSDATMVIGKNRIAIGMRFTTVENKITNYTIVAKS
jgi:hypothetical protein